MDMVRDLMIGNGYGDGSGQVGAVCDDTQNLNETESETFFRYQIFPIPNPILFSIPNFFDTESETG